MKLNLNSTLSKNITAGLMVSFIAMPLCIAIAIASQFPPLAGVFTAIIGGIIVSQINGSFVTITGPAAGMIIVIADATTNLANLQGGDLFLGYKSCLAAIVVASIIQVICGFTNIANYLRKFPESIIRGMMTAIGLIIILKQIFTIFGYKIPKESLIMLVTDIPHAFLGAQSETLILGLLTITVIIFWQNFVIKKFPQLKTIPIYLILIIIGSFIAYKINISNYRHYIQPNFANPPQDWFINLPKDWYQAITLPDFQHLFSYQFWLAVLTIFAVGSLETILSAIAVDKLDPLKRNSNLPKDLRAIGIGNIICGSVGGLPMISEVVRSSANVSYGATNKWANFSHGLFLLIFVLFFNNLLGKIPLAILASMLIVIGINLINFKLLKNLYHEDKASIIIIATTVFFTIYVDLLVGIIAGLVTFKIIAVSKNYFGKN